MLADFSDVGAVHVSAGNVGTLTGAAQPVRVEYLAGMDRENVFYYHYVSKD